MLTAASIARMVVPSLALVAAGGALLFFGVPQVRRELPVEAGAAAAARPTVGAASIAAPHRSSDADDELTPVFDIARIDPTGDAVIAGRAAPSVSVELLRNGYVHDRAVADRSGQFVMVPPRLPPGDSELTLRSRQPDGKEATSKRSVVVTLQPKMVEAPMTLDKQEAGIAVQPKMVEAPMALDKQEAGIAAYQHGDFAGALRLFQPLAEHGDASAQCNLGVMYEQGRGVAQNYREAMKWFRLAAVQGNASAQSNLGVMYYKGQGIAQDYGEAMRWYRLAAEQRNPEAQFNLGVMYAAK
jgi:tetratricopeptide (TPR) repeat protein